MDIDFVLTWVDGSDPVWREEKRKYQSDASCDDGEERYRDWDMLQFWFRGVETFAPWVRKVHLITYGHLPKWLDTKHPKLHIVRHEDFLPKELLPVFNSTVLEEYLHRIEGLAEHFVYFNDDMFLLRPIKEEVFFQRGLPCDMMAFQPVVANPRSIVTSYLYLNNAAVLARNFDKRECVRRHPGHFYHPGYPLLYLLYNVMELTFPLFTGFYTVHGPSPFLKQTFLDVWKCEGRELETAAHSRFRSKNDVSQYLFREWQKLSGNFVPKNVHRKLGYFELDMQNKRLLATIVGQKKKWICINDTGKVTDIEPVKEQLRSAFLRILPNRSSFEK